MRTNRTAAITLALLAALAGVGTTLIATSDARANNRAIESDIAVVDVERVYGQLDELESRNGELLAEAKLLQDKIDAQVQKIEGLRDHIDALAETAIAQRREKEIELIEANALLQGRQQAFQQKLNIEEGDLIREMYAKIILGVEEVAKQDAYRVVLFDNRRIPLPQGGVDAVNGAILNKSLLYVDNAVDITNAVITKMNNEFAAAR